MTNDQRFRLVNDYAHDRGYFAGFPNFHEADYGQGPVGGVILLRESVADWRDVPRDEYGVYHIEDVPALFRSANDYAANNNFAAAFPNCHQADHGQGVVYGTILIKHGVTEWRDVPRAALGDPEIHDVPAMMTAANDYAAANGFYGAFPTFHQNKIGDVVVYGVVLFKLGMVDWRDVSLQDLAFLEPRDERTCVILCQFRDNGVLTGVPQQPDYYRRYFFEDGQGQSGLFDYYRDVTNGKIRVTGDVFGWFDIGHTLTEHRAAQGQAQRTQAYNWGIAAARGQGVAVDGYPRRVVIVNTTTDFGGSAGGMLMGHGGGAGIHHAYWQHEFGHVLGLDDSFGPGGRYQDFYCVMSAATTPFMFTTTIQGETFPAGPGLNGVYVHRLGGFQRSRIVNVIASEAGETVRLAALGQGAHDLPYFVQVDATALTPNTYWVEYRHPSGWDQGIGRPSAVVHESRPGDGASYLLQGPNQRALRSPGDELSVAVNQGSPGRALVFRLLAIESGERVAHLSIRFASSWWHFDLTDLAVAPAAVDDPFGYLTAGIPGQSPIGRVVYRSADGHIHELSHAGQVTGDRWEHFDRTDLAVAPAAVGDPFGYLTAGIPGQSPIGRVVYRSADGHIHELSHAGQVTGDRWEHFDLTDLAVAPAAVGDPFGYLTAGIPGQSPIGRVVYRSADGHIHELSHAGQVTGDRWEHFDLTDLAVAPAAVGDPFGYLTAGIPGQSPIGRVVYRSADGHIHELSHAGQVTGDRWEHFDLTDLAVAPAAVGDPFGYLTAGIPGQSPIGRVVYRSADGHIHELSHAGQVTGNRWEHFDLTDLAVAPAAVGDPFGYLTAGIPSQSPIGRVVYRSADGHIHELSHAGQVTGNRWEHFDLTDLAVAPAAVGDSFGYLTAGIPGQSPIGRVVYRSADGHIHELAHAGLTPTT